MLSSLLLAISLSGSIQGQEVDPWVAPRLDPIPQGMGLPIETEFGKEKCFADDGTWLPLDRGNAVKMMIADCMTLSIRCQARLDAAKVLSEPPRAWPGWAVAAIGIVSFVSGVALTVGLSR